MKTIDRYIIRQFMLNFIILLVVLMGMIIMIDLVLQMDEFVKEARRLVKADESPHVLIALVKTAANFYLPFIPLLYIFLTGLITVAAMGFTFTAMSRAGELVALAASGISMYRLAVPVLVTAAALNAVTLVCQEWVLPPLAPRLMRKHAHLQNETMKQFNVYLSPDEQGRLFTGQFVPDDHDPRLENLTVLVRNEKGQTIERLSAPQAFWNEGRHGWELVGVNRIRWLAGQQASFTTAPGQDTPTPGVPQADTQPDGDEGTAFIITSLSPQVLMAKQRAFFARLLSMVDLQDMLRNPSVNRAEIIKIMHSRLSMIVLNVLVLAMGLPFFLSREPGHPLKQVVTAAGVCMGAWFTGLVILQIPASQVNPVMSAWLPVSLCLIAAAALMTRIRT